jgi:hypothetical protein
VNFKEHEILTDATQSQPHAVATILDYMGRWYDELNLSEAAKTLLIDLYQAAPNFYETESEIKPAEWELIAKGILHKGEECIRDEETYRTRKVLVSLYPEFVTFVAIEFIKIERELAAKRLEIANAE